MPDIEGCGFDISEEAHDEQRQHEETPESPGAEHASLRLRELLQQYALRRSTSARVNAGPGPQQEDRHDGPIPLSKLLPRRRVDPRTACCTFSHLLQLHTHCFVKLEQQEQQLHMPQDSPYPEVYVHLQESWGTSDVAGKGRPQEGEQQQEEEGQQQQEDGTAEERTEERPEASGSPSAYSSEGTKLGQHQHREPHKQRRLPHDKGAKSLGGQRERSCLAPRAP